MRHHFLVKRVGPVKLSEATEMPFVVCSNLSEQASLVAGIRRLLRAVDHTLILALVVICHDFACELSDFDEARRSCNEVKLIALVFEPHQDVRWRPGIQQCTRWIRSVGCISCIQCT